MVSANDNLEFQGTPEQLAALEEVKQIAHRFEELVDELKNSYCDFEKARNHTMFLLDSSISTIDWHQNNSNVATVAGASAGVVGGMLVVGGLCAAPFTGGASLAAVGAGGAMSAAGAGTQIGNALTVNKLISDEMNKAQEELQRDTDAWNRFEASANCLKAEMEQMAESMEDSNGMTGYQKVMMGVQVCKFAKSMHGFASGA